MTFLAVAALGIVLLFLVPLTFSLSLSFGPSLRGKILVAGIFPVLFPRPKKKTEAPGKGQAPAPTEKKKGKFGKLLKMFLEPGYRNRAGKSVARLVRRVLRAVKIKGLGGRVVFGAGDPADTGRMLGKYHEWRYALFPLGAFDNFTLTPDFTGKKLEGEVRGKILVSIGRVLLALLLLLFEFPLIKTIAALRRRG